ncbi:hypothetical protein [Rickettsiales endosymbiont of Stachyamoeba lipophora]|uniref:hypothetical protein n=1 Tax=Rickettsiales endosymbiont of Stachyamoeba lipophora TaxID=2486578 RepID=UPI000F64CD9A|nr:hypothetical protein [Rickettsiales endosymbiont of Stachyamoeba lipophora]AZL15324.1 hypothetical protein EF513_01970 [Rickettsiales endosymbiont of Stachyamoeba lipophora]
MKFRIEALTSLVLKTAAIGLGLVYGLPVLGLAAPLWLIGVTAVFAAGILNNTRFNLNLGKYGSLLTFFPAIGISLYYLLPIIGISLSVPMIALVTAGLATLHSIAENNINIDDNNLPIWKKILSTANFIAIGTEVASYRTLLSSLVITALFPAIGNYHIALRLGAYILPAIGYFALECMEYNPINLMINKVANYITSTENKIIFTELQQITPIVEHLVSGQWEDIQINPKGDLQPKSNQSWVDYLLDTINPLASVISR